MNPTAMTVYRGRLRGSKIGASIQAAVCESLGIQSDAPGVKLRGFTFVGESLGLEEKPDVIFDLVVRQPTWARIPPAR